MTIFTSAKVTLQEHSNQSTHKNANLIVVDFVNCMEKGALSVYQQMQDQAFILV